MKQPIVGISACLLGKKVRHDGGHKAHEWLINELGKFVTWVPICPEMEMSLGVPRKSLRLIGNVSDPQLIVKGSEENITPLAKKSVIKILSIHDNFDSYILKKDSPSCGLERVKIYDHNNYPARSAKGIFAAALREKHPFIPLIEEGRLSDNKQRELYVVRLFAYTQFRQLKLSTQALQIFHQKYKYLLMAYAPSSYQELGKIAANSSKRKPKQLFADYQVLFSSAIHRIPTRKQWVNVLEHMTGYFKEVLSSPEKQQLRGIIEEYRRNELPLVAVLTLFKHLSKQYKITYLENQELYEPYPKSLNVWSA